MYNINRLLSVLILPKENVDLTNVKSCWGLSQYFRISPATRKQVIKTSKLCSRFIVIHGSCGGREEFRQVMMVYYGDTWELWWHSRVKAGYDGILK